MQQNPNHTKFKINNSHSDAGLNDPIDKDCVLDQAVTYLEKLDQSKGS